MSRLWRPAALLAAALITSTMAGCGTSESGGTYDHAADIVTALEKGGLVCPKYSPITTPKGAAERGECWPSADDNVIVSTYATHSDAAAAVDAQRKLGVGVGMLTGENWTLAGGGTGFRAKAKEILGGTLVEEKAP